MPWGPHWTLPCCWSCPHHRYSSRRFLHPCLVLAWNHPCYHHCRHLTASRCMTFGLPLPCGPGRIHLPLPLALDPFGRCGESFHNCLPCCCCFHWLRSFHTLRCHATCRSCCLTGCCRCPCCCLCTGRTGFRIRKIRMSRQWGGGPEDRHRLCYFPPSSAFCLRSKGHPHRDPLRDDWYCCRRHRGGERRSGRGLGGAWRPWSAPPGGAAAAVA